MREQNIMSGEDLNKLGKLLERSGIAVDEIGRIEKVNTWQGFYKDADKKAQHVDMIGAQFVPVPDDTDPYVSKSPPVKITPSKAKPAKREHTVIVSVPDEQIGYRSIDGELVPIHDEAAMGAARAVIKAIKPDIIVAQGDTLDFAELSRFAPDSDHFVKTTQASIDRAGLWDAELTADNPNSQRVRLAGNHDRITKFILKNAMQVHGIKRANVAPEEWPVLSIPYLLRADETGWNYITGYPANEFRYADDFVFVHGDKVASNGSTAKKMSVAYPDRNVVFGHVHRREEHTSTNHRGESFTARTFGTLARIDGYVPSYGNGVDERGAVVERYENWQQGIGVISDYGEGRYVLEPVPIEQGSAIYRDKEYQAE